MAWIIWGDVWNSMFHVWLFVYLEGSFWPGSKHSHQRRCDAMKMYLEEIVPCNWTANCCHLSCQVAMRKGMYILTLFQIIRKLWILNTISTITISWISSQINWNSLASLFPSGRRIMFQFPSFHSMFVSEQKSFALFFVVAGIHADIKNIVILEVFWSNNIYRYR